MCAPMPPFTTPPSADDLVLMAEQALTAFPPALAARVRGVSILVEDAADGDTLDALGLDSPWQLTGLYRGVPWGRRSSADTPDAPDVILLYREPILLEWIETGEELGELVRTVLVHEIAHHFGFSDAEIAALEAGR